MRPSRSRRPRESMPTALAIANRDCYLRPINSLRRALEGGLIDTIKAVAGSAPKSSRCLYRTGETRWPPDT